jgi:hypothetical protein
MLIIFSMRGLPIPRSRCPPTTCTPGDFCFPPANTPPARFLGAMTQWNSGRRGSAIFSTLHSRTGIGRHGACTFYRQDLQVAAISTWSLHLEFSKCRAHPQPHLLSPPACMSNASSGVNFQRFRLRCLRMLGYTGGSSRNMRSRRRIPSERRPRRFRSSRAY